MCVPPAGTIIDSDEAMAFSCEHLDRFQGFLHKFLGFFRLKNQTEIFFEAKSLLRLKLDIKRSFLGIIPPYVCVHSRFPSKV